MEKSTSIIEITKALVKFREKLPKINLNSTVKVQTKTGSSYSFRYADLPHIKETADPVLCANGLFVSQLIEPNGELTTIVMHESGEYIQSTMTLGTIKEKTAQEYGGLITYCKRYAYCSALGIVAEEDDDANSSDGNSYTKTTMADSAPAEKSWLNPKTKEWEAAVDYLKGGGTIDKIESKYRISKPNRENLMTESI